MQLTGRRILLIISGGIAAYKALELIRLIKRNGGDVRCILTKGGAQFVTPLSVAALSGEKIYDDLWSLTDEAEMGHIRLSREADLIVVAPASADLMAKMVQGRADDLASTVLLAANKPILIAPAMNPAMWDNAATQTNIATLKQRGVNVVGPSEGDMACGEYGTGRMLEAQQIFDAITATLTANKPLAGKHAIVTSGPTHEPIDPVRYIGNRSSGKQGHAIAQALAHAGAAVTLVTGPVSIAPPEGVKTIAVETADQMMEAVRSALPADIAVFAAAVADWKPEAAHADKLKKRENKSAPPITLIETPDILRTIGTLPNTLRPRLVIGFAAETTALIDHAKAKLTSKGADIILANNVEGGAIFNAETTHLHCITHAGTQDWGTMDKRSAAQTLTDTIITHLKGA